MISSLRRVWRDQTGPKAGTKALFFRASKKYSSIAGTLSTSILTDFEVPEAFFRASQ
ncbi:hypothetical protein X738_18285 [Mesorhizobium sp. LNHC209A00]|nr:hypothetical protein X738_18285 [Mesorhizobium sp. LNHC209A00]